MASARVGETRTSHKVVLVIAVVFTTVMGIYFISNEKSSNWDMIGYSEYNSDIQTASPGLTTATFTIPSTTIHNTSMITTSSKATARPTTVYSKVPATNYPETTLNLVWWRSLQEQRHVSMLRGCEHLNLKSGPLTERGTPARHILVNDKYKLMYCFIPKVRYSWG